MIIYEMIDTSNNDELYKPTRLFFVNLENAQNYQKIINPNYSIYPRNTVDSNNEWIKCSERMPAKWEKVILYSKRPGIKIGVLTDTGWGLDEDYISDMSYSGYRTIAHKSVFTHWMQPSIAPEVKE